MHYTTKMSVNILLLLEARIAQALSKLQMTITGSIYHVYRELDELNIFHKLSY